MADRTFEQPNVTDAGAAPGKLKDMGDTTFAEVIYPAIDTYSADATSFSAQGDTTFHTPAAGKAVRVHYACLSADPANAAGVVCTIKFGASGSAKYIVGLAPGVNWARNIGAGRHYIQGPKDAPLIVNLSAAVVVYPSFEYEEV
ncbi:MAG: hypothetical protein ACYDAY_11475 [Candidatus Dormibacteria bacterium]